MQRYHGGSCTSAVNNSTIGGSSARDSSRVESTSLPPNFSRRPQQLASYKLKCDKEPLNSRLGPPDFHPQTPHCPEETLTKEYVQSGYRETVEGLEEAREISLTQVQAFTKPVIFKCKEAIRKCHRAINESRAQKRKAGQVYGVPLEGLQLTKPGIFPDQRSCGEEFRKKWIEGLSQQHKRLRSLADHVPHGYRRKSLFEVLIRNNVPLLRATWFVKVTYLNQVRPGSSSMSSGVPDKTHISRSEQWTKDVIDYLQHLLDEFISRNGVHSALHIRDRSPQIVYAGSVQLKSEPTFGTIDGEEPTLHFKWWYVVRILQWHHREGLLIPSLVIDWMLNQLQEKGLLGVLQLLLPVIYGFIDTVVLSQSYVRTLVGLAIRFIQEPSPGGSDLVDNSRRAYTTAALVEMLRYLMLAVPDTFVALDCFPMAPCVLTDGSLYSKVAEDAGKAKNGPFEVAHLLRDKGPDVQFGSYSVARVVSSIQKRAQNLAMAARPGHPGKNVAKALHALDKALAHGDLREAYEFLFENVHGSSVDDCWFAEVSSCLRSSLMYIGSVTLSSICSIFLICEWATCDFRDFRNAPPREVKFTGRKDLSAIYVAVRILKLRMREVGVSSRHREHKILKNDHLRRDPGQLTNYSGRSPASGVSESICFSKRARGKCSDFLGMFDSPSPLHDILVCWIDQHEMQNTEGFKRLQLLIIELIRAGVFYPQAYVRQLIVSGIMDGNGPLSNPMKQKRHCKILKHLPGRYVHDALEEAQVTDSHVLSEVMNVYCNERKLVLHGMIDWHSTACGSSYLKRKPRPNTGESQSPPSIDQLRPAHSGSVALSNDVRRGAELEELKGSITTLLQYPSTLSTDTGVDESQVSLKKAVVSGSNGMDSSDGTPGCEECRRAKKQKLSEDKSSYSQIYPQNPSDDEETWWMPRGQKSIESFRAEPPPPKPVAKPASRGRQKIVRKTQSLAQLAAARIEGSQGASTSHVCDSKISCPHHRPGIEANLPKAADGTRMPNRDVFSIGKVLKRLRFVEKRTMALWLIGIVKQLVEEAEKNVAKVGQYGRPFSAADERGSVRWKLGEDELSAVLYLMDSCDELVLAARFLLWLLPKVLGSCSATVHGSKNILTIPKIAENNVCEVGETYLLSSMRRYESIIVAADLIPETLSVVMHRAQAILTSNGRVSGSPAVIYARYLLKKYCSVGSVTDWEKNAKPSFDKRLASEVESGRLLDGEFGFPLGVPVGVQDLDDFFRQKITGARASRVGLNMRDIVQKKVDEAVNYFYGKDRKHFGLNSGRSPGFHKWEDGYQIGQQIVTGLMDCMRQTGGAAQEGDPTLVSSAISAIVCNVWQVIVKIPDLTASNNHLSFSSTPAPLHYAQCILRIHVTCLCILKEALGERQSRVFEVALATETSSALAQVFGPGKAARSQFQLSPESNDSNLSSDILNNSSRIALGRAAKISAAVSALVVGAILQGVASLERMVSLFRLKDGLDIVHFVRSMRSNSNGNARSHGTLKADSLAEVSVHWFRVLVGNCRTVSDGFIVDLLGEPSILGLCRMQRTLPLNLVFPPAYSMFAFVLWRPLIVNVSSGTRDDIQQLHHSLLSAFGDVIKHIPFREVCLRDTQSLYDLIALDTVDTDFASLLETNGVDMRSKASAFVPLRARLFLNALIDCRIPHPIVKQDDGNHVQGELKFHCVENETRLLDKLVHILDTLQPAKFHWQWVELRLLLNEQAVIEKLEGHDLSLVEALRSLSPNTDKASVSENESNIIEMILTRLLVRPDAAPLFAEVVHLLGRSLEDSMLLQAKWFLGGNDVLLGRKSVRQRLINIAASRGLSTKAQYWKPWGWCPFNSDLTTGKGEKLKREVSSIEEGEVVDDGNTSKRPAKGSGHTVDVEGFHVTQQFVTERALVDLILPCLDQASDDSRNTFATDMIKQMNHIEQQINAVTREASKPAGTVASGVEGPITKSSRKGSRGSSPGLARRATGPAEKVPPSPVALRASLSLRLQFILRLFPLIYADREPSGRNMRCMLSSVILRILGSRVVHEDASHSFNQAYSSKREVDSLVEASAAASVVMSTESLFDRLLLLLHGLLSSHTPCWLKWKSSSKSPGEFSKDYSVFEREAAESLQNELERMQLPETVRWRIQSAMPIVFPSIRCLISCQPPSVAHAALSTLVPSNPISVLHSSSNPTQRNPVSLLRAATSVAGKAKHVSSQQQDSDVVEVDPWILLEDGAGSSQSSNNSTLVGGGDHSNLKASNWLKGTVRVRRTDLTYIGAVDDDS